MRKASHQSSINARASSTWSRIRPTSSRSCSQVLLEFVDAPLPLLQFVLKLRDAVSRFRCLGLLHVCKLLAFQHTLTQCLRALLQFEEVAKGGCRTGGVPAAFAECSLRRKMAPLVGRQS